MKKLKNWQRNHKEKNMFSCRIFSESYMIVKKNKRRMRSKRFPIQLFKKRVNNFFYKAANAEFPYSGFGQIAWSSEYPASIDYSNMTFRPIL